MTGPSSAIVEDSSDTADFTFTLAHAVGHDVTVVFETDGMGDNPATAGSYPTWIDYQGVSGTLTFLAGQTVPTVGATGSLEIGDDTVAEEDETFAMNILSVSGGFTDVAEDSVVATIEDDD